MSDHITGPYTAIDEREFMRNLIDRRQYEAAINYCRLIVRGQRRWDKTVNEGEVKRYAEEFMAIARAALNGVAR